MLLTRRSRTRHRAPCGQRAGLAPVVVGPGAACRPSNHVAVACQCTSAARLGSATAAVGVRVYTARRRCARRIEKGVRAGQA